MRIQVLHLGRPRVLILLALLIAFPAWMTVTTSRGDYPGVDPWRMLWGSLAFGPLMGGLQVWQWHRLYRKTPLADGIEGEVSERGLTVRSSTFSGELLWSAFRSARFGEDMVLLYQSPMAFNIVARPMFASEDDWVKAVALIRANSPRDNVATSSTAR
jgi:hypothetical protein